MRLIQWCHFASPTQLTYTHKNEYANRHVYSQMLLHSNEHTLHHHHLRTILYESFQLHPTFWQEAPLFFYCLLYHQRTRFHFFFQSKIEILQAYLHVRPHTHVRTKDTHIHRDTQIHTPCGHAFFYFPVSNNNKKKKIEERSERRSVEGRELEAERYAQLCV